MTFAKILPMAFVMVAGPQILSAVFLATSPRWRPDSLAYVGVDKPRESARLWTLIAHRR